MIRSKFFSLIDLRCFLHPYGWALESELLQLMLDHFDRSLEHVQEELLFQEKVPCSLEFTHLFRGVLYIL